MNFFCLFYDIIYLYFESIFIIFIYGIYEKMSLHFELYNLIVIFFWKTIFKFTVIIKAKSNQ